MCLVTQQKEVIILKKDITVFKLLRKGLKGSHQLDFQYELDKLYKTELGVTLDVIESDIVPLDIEVMNAYIKDGNFIPNLTQIAEGFHSFMNVDRTLSTQEYLQCKFASYVIVKCTVPAGSEVFYDVTGLCVSNQIIIDEIIETKDY